MRCHQAVCFAVIGASGTGKGVYVKDRLNGRLDGRPLLVWSPLEATDRYAATFNGIIVRSIAGLCTRVRGRAPVIVFAPSLRPKMLKQQFDLFCRTAWLTRRAIVLVEELSRVTSASYAPASWQNLSTAGRHQGLTVIGTAQRPAMIDKDFLGNCTELHAGRVNYESDARALAAVFHLPHSYFLELPDLHYVHRYMRELRNERGVQALPASRRRVQKKTMA
jgi:hypothetical protein